MEVFHKWLPVLSCEIAKESLWGDALGILKAEMRCCDKLINITAASRIFYVIYNRTYRYEISLKSLQYSNDLFPFVHRRTLHMYFCFWQTIWIILYIYFSHSSPDSWPFSSECEITGPFVLKQWTASKTKLESWRVTQ